MCQDLTNKNCSPREDAAAPEACRQGWSNDRIYAHLARALARGYTDLYYVNMETDEFIEFHTDDSFGVLTEARRRSDFFEGCERDAKLYVHAEDQAAFVQAMNREFLTEALDRSRVFEMTYRRIKDGRTFYVGMKVSRMEDDRRIVVIAVSDIDELIRQRQTEAKIQEERIVYARLHALTGNYICVYVVDPKTSGYREFYATDDYTDSFAQVKKGDDFFRTAREVSRRFNHPDDLEHFLATFTRENILAEIEKSGIFTLSYRLMMNDRPLHVQITAAIVEEKESPRLIVGLSDVDAQYRQQETERELARQKDIYGQITESLTEQYDTLYYINIEDNTYVEISSTDEYKKLNVPATGNNFFTESRRSIRRYVHPEDQEKALSVHFKDVMLANLRNRRSFAVAYRLVVDGQVRHIRHTEIMSMDRKHIIVCIKNIDAEVQAELAMKAVQKRSTTYTQIAERLADHYDLIYYIDCETSSYSELSTKQKSGELKIQDEGDDFFAAAQRNMERLVYSEDRSRIRLFLDRDNLISQLEGRRQLTEDYRMVTDSGKTQYTRMTVSYSLDHSHFIICVENREEDVRREKEHLAALSMANELARRDELTHTKNKTAYQEAERELQRHLDEACAPFGIAVCDINGLKLINDTEGHKAGDDYIKASCMMICRIFHHSPVFRIGGDEFAVILKGQDYQNRDQLISNLRRQSEENTRMSEGPVVASGLAEYHAHEDRSVEDVFRRADTQMYADKARLKELKHRQESHSLKEKASVRAISDERRLLLDTLFKSFEIVSEGTYVFLCDMKYDFSRWSKTAVDAYGLPSEYMYGAGDIWENQIHSDDRAAYHRGIDEIFAGNAAGHDMQYRARRTTGEYDVCTCRGVVLRDLNGEPDYFAGTIRNHGKQGHIDTLTGLRNQYGFFEDLDSCIKRSTRISVVLFGISRFSEINEIYGYHFGNRVLQLYARAVFETTGNYGHSYRIDGTKFAVISNTLSVDELRKGYNRFRTWLHEDFRVDGRKLLLDLHCGALRVDSFDIDSQTVYSCLNYADEESKLRRHGNLVEFRNNLNAETHQRLEKLHAIRASIMHGCEGFYLLYQPVVDAETEQLIGAEALLRWKNDRYGAVPPDHFIPVLESDPIFPELGDWILRESVFTAKQFLNRNPGFVINVNLSYTQLEKPDFADRLLGILNELEYPPEHLCLEVTERCRLLDLELLKNVIVSLKSKGILIALDDFGTGFSSIGVLKEIPFNIIKIDRGFVQAVEKDNTDRQIIQTIADLASIFSAKICVEGIETAGMRDILVSYHVESFQGYYYGRPMPSEQLLDWRTHNTH
ncbi:MAG: EAL domain-containing protein [Oscillospiraceae bacterium]|nr:EAL domain-containing protein [Oscillospiraceae bacterium]